MRHLRSMPAKQHPTAQDYGALRGILTAALTPACAPAASTWSCGDSLMQLAGAAATPATAVSSRKRLCALPAASAASNLFSAWSDVDTAIESKRLRLQLECEQEVDGASTAGGMLVVTQSQD
jgi:hypothetical protein